MYYIIKGFANTYVSFSRPRYFRIEREKKREREREKRDQFRVLLSRLFSRWIVLLCATKNTSIIIHGITTTEVLENIFIYNNNPMFLLSFYWTTEGYKRNSTNNQFRGGRIRKRHFFLFQIEIFVFDLA